MTYSFRFHFQNNHTLMQIKLYEISEESSLIVTLRSVRELDDFLESRLRRRLLKRENTSRQLDVMSEIQGKFVLD